MDHLIGVVEQPSLGSLLYSFWSLSPSPSCKFGYCTPCVFSFTLFLLQFVVTAPGRRTTFFNPSSITFILTSTINFTVLRLYQHVPSHVYFRRSGTGPCRSGSCLPNARCSTCSCLNIFTSQELIYDTFSLLCQSVLPSRSTLSQSILNARFPLSSLSRRRMAALNHTANVRFPLSSPSRRRMATLSHTASARFRPNSLSRRRMAALNHTANVRFPLNSPSRRRMVTLSHMASARFRPSSLSRRRMAALSHTANARFPLSSLSRRRMAALNHTANVRFPLSSPSRRRMAALNHTANVRFPIEGEALSYIPAFCSSLIIGLSQRCFLVTFGIDWMTCLRLWR